METETSCAPVSDSFDEGKDLTEQSNRQSMDTPQNWLITKAKSRKGKQKVQRKTLKEWLQSFTWMQFDENSDKVFCRICREFPKIADKKKTKFVEGLTPFKKETLVIHAKSRCHILCVKQLQAQEKFETPVVIGLCSGTDEESVVQQSNVSSTPQLEEEK